MIAVYQRHEYKMFVQRYGDGRPRLTYVLAGVGHHRLQPSIVERPAGHVLK